MTNISTTISRGRGRPPINNGARRTEFGNRLLEVIASYELRRPDIERAANLRLGQLSDYVNGYAVAGVKVATRIVEAMPIRDDDKQVLYRAAARVYGWPLAPDPYPGNFSI